MEQGPSVAGGAITAREIVAELNENLSVRLWPTAGRALGISRPTTYLAAGSGEIPTNRFGRKLTVPSAWLREKLALVDEARAA